MNKKNVVLSLSGGMDSSTLLLKCLFHYENVYAISFDYGQKHKLELERAQDLVDYINKTLFPHQVYVNYKVIKLDGLSSLLNSTLVEGGNEVPEGHYEQENMKDTVVPNRNKIFSSIIQAAALSIVNKTGEDCDIALGIHAGDHAIYPDCRQEFRDADMEAFRIGNWDSEKVNVYTPYIDKDKFGILQDGQWLCKELELNFNEVYSRTNTSYKPIFIVESFIEPDIEIFGTKQVFPKEGLWYSDYKSASSVERIEAFIKLGRPDPVAYADETGPVEWNVAKSYVEKVLDENSSK